MTASADATSGAVRRGVRTQSTGRSFVGHESFPLRYGWLKRCIDAVAACPEVFADDDAVIALGVGKNMARAVRHWALVARMVEEVPGSRGKALRATPLGHALFADGGFDPYLEDPRTLWLLHWQLCTHPEKATTWRWVFGEWSRAAFTRDELRGVLRTVAAGLRASASTLERDIEVLLRTYLPSRASRGTPLEDSLDSPLVELSLLREDPVEGRIERVRGAQPGLDDTLFGFAVLDHWARTAPGLGTLHLDALQHTAGAPGRVLGLDDRALVERLERAEVWSRGALRYDHTAGQRQLLRRESVDPVTWLLEALARDGTVTP